MAGNEGNLLPPDDPEEDALRTARVAMPLPIGPYDYAVPPERDYPPGTPVIVPLGNRRAVGIVLGPGDGSVPREKLKPIAAALDCPPLPPVSLAFVDWVSRYTMATVGAVLKMVVSVPDALEPPKPVAVYRLPGTADGDEGGYTGGDPPSTGPARSGPLRITPARRRVLDVLADGVPLTGPDLTRLAECSTAVVKGMVEAGLIVAESRAPRPPHPPPDISRPRAVLSDDQAAVADALQLRTTEGGFAVTLLDGVTGSGKTEVYFEAIAAALAAGRQALVLLPEIALSAQWLDRFEARFGVRPAQWHSEVGASQRVRTWRAVAEGTARVVVGARSSLFLPYPDLGLIVVDEEHEAAFKQEDGGALYHARDMAVVRAKLGDIPIVLASATPSVESMVNAWTGRYAHAILPSRHNNARLPDIEIIDLREHKPEPGCFLSMPVVTSVLDAFRRDEQAMLFLNRRGYAPLTLCNACGHRLQCPHCTAWLVEHRLTRRLVCHHCDYRSPPPRSCPHCGEADSFVPCGPGIERVAEEVDARLPDARWAIAASDILTKPADMANLVAQTERGEINLLIGTQMLAKGHHFPALTAVGVVDADLGLHGGDLRAAERTFQLLTQVSGRAGRGNRPGRVLLQTRDPDNPVIQALAAGDRDGFLELEAQSRAAAGMPPYGRLAAVVLAGKDEREVEGFARRLAACAPHRARTDGGGWWLEVLGPSLPPLAILRGNHRRRLLVKASRDAPLQALLREWLPRVQIPARIRLAVDIDPQGFL